MRLKCMVIHGGVTDRSQFTGRCGFEQAQELIARMWHGLVPTSIYGVNRGAWCLQRTEGPVTHVLMTSHWDNVDAIKRFAGEDYLKAKDYDFDADYLIEMEAKVEHFDIRAASQPNEQPRSTGTLGSFAGLGS
jgi:hypothetical protein